MKKTKIFSLIMAGALVSSVMAGCGSTQTSSTGTNTTTATDKSPITITMYSADASALTSKFTDPVAKEITKETGVTLKIEYPVAGNDRVPLMIAGGEYPDIIYAKADTSKLISSGAFLSLDKYIASSPNIKKVYGAYLNRLKYSTSDPHIYTLGAYAVQPQGTPLWTDSGTFELQHAVLKDQSYPKLKTLDDYEAAIKAYMKKYPTINGQKTIGLSLSATDWRWMITLGNPSDDALGNFNNGEWNINQTTGKATYKFTVDAYKQYYKWLNKMNSEGLVDPDSFTQKFDQYQAKIASGRVLALSDANWDYQTSVTSLTKAGMEDRTYLSLPITIDSKTKTTDLADMGYNIADGIGISKSCKDPKRVMQFLDWMGTDKAQVLLHWGIEGTNYKIVNGKRVVPASEQAKKNSDQNYSADTGVGKYAYPFPEYGDGVKDSSGQYYTANSPQTIIDGYNSAMKTTLKAYGVKRNGELFPQTSEFKQLKYPAAWTITIPQDSDVATILTAADNESQKMLPAVVAASPADFDKVWAQYQADLKNLNIDKANQGFTKLLSDKLKLWNSK